MTRGLEEHFDLSIPKIDHSSFVTRHSRALLQRSVTAARRTYIDLPGARNLLLRVQDHLLPLSEPTARSGNGEHHRKHIHRNFHALIDETGVEIDIGIEPPGDEILVL